MLHRKTNLKSNMVLRRSDSQSNQSPRTMRSSCSEIHQQQQHKNNEAIFILIIKPPPSQKLLGTKFFASTNFQLLKAYESPLPLYDYLSQLSQPVSVVIAPAFVPITSDLIQLLPDLRLVVTTSAGVDLAECRLRGISVTNIGCVYSEDVADTAVGLLLDVFRRISAANRFVRQGFWSVLGEFPLGFTLKRKRVGIVGLGSIGSMVATRLEAFGCQISYNSRSQKPSVSYPYYKEVQEMAANSDALIICCELNEKTWHLINRDVLSALGKEGVIVNVARGAIIDEKEMVRCLKAGELGGAGLDVFEDEPNVPEELFGLDNVVMAPHSGNKTLDGVEESERILIRNIEAFFSNKPLPNHVLDCRQWKQVTS